TQSTILLTDADAQETLLSYSLPIFFGKTALNVSFPPILERETLHKLGYRASDEQYFLAFVEVHRNKATLLLFRIIR
ncbi:MAG: hypothetical protein QW173_05180, partial [Candidatus Caldarchaeum sp.]